VMFLERILQSIWTGHPHEVDFKLHKTLAEWKKLLNDFHPQGAREVQVLVGVKNEFNNI
jgi:hypothetical protein